MELLDKLKAVLPPPRDPLEVPSEGDWAVLARRFAEVPPDYKDLIGAYGTGTIDMFLWVLNPVAENEHLNLERRSKVLLAALGESAEKFPEYFSRPLFPATGGLLPCAITDNGDTVFWETEGAPARWPIVVMGPRAPELFRFPGGIVDFLYAVLSRATRCDRFPKEFPSEDVVVFTPSRG